MGYLPAAADIVLGTAEKPYPYPQYRLSQPQQAYHGLVWGQTGTGKSRMLQSVALQHLDKGNGVGLIEPHSDLSLGALKYLVAQRYFDRPDAFEKLIYIDFSPERGVPFNILSGHGDPHSRALNAMDAMIRTWPDLETAPLFRTLFPCACLTLIANNLPLTALLPLLQDAQFRDACLSRVSDPLVHEVFVHYSNLGRGQAHQAASTIRRVFILTFSPVARACLGQRDNLLDFRRLLDSGNSLIVNLGSVGDSDTRRFLGASLLVQLEQAALSRADIPERDRRPWTLLLDEWPTFSAQGETLANILTQTRKFRLSLYLAAQAPSQIDGRTLAAALENCRLSVTFRLGRESAEMQARHVANLDPYRVKTAAHNWSGRDQYMSLSEQRESWSQAIANLPPQYAFVKLSGEPPVRIRTLTVRDRDVPDGVLAEVLSEYRRRYQRPATAFSLNDVAARPADQSVTLVDITQNGHNSLLEDLDWTEFREQG